MIKNCNKGKHHDSRFAINFTNILKGYLFPGHYRDQMQTYALSAYYLALNLHFSRTPF